MSSIDINDKILGIYDKFQSGEISSEIANISIELFTEMKSKEEYHRRKLFNNSNSAYKIDYNKDTDENNDIRYRRRAIKEVLSSHGLSDALAKPSNKAESIAMGLDPAKRVDLNKYRSEIEDKINELKNAHEEKRKNSFKNNGTINTGNDKAKIYISKHSTSHNDVNGYEFINMNTKDLRNDKVKDLKVKLAHELGHHSKNPIEIPERVRNLIDDILGKNEEKIIPGNKHTDKSELIADYRAVKQLGKYAVLRTLHKSAKDAHRQSRYNTPEGIDQDIKLRTKFINSLTNDDLK